MAAKVIARRHSDLEELNKVLEMENESTPLESDDILTSFLEDPLVFEEEEENFSLPQLKEDEDALETFLEMGPFHPYALEAVDGPQEEGGEVGFFIDVCLTETMLVLQDSGSDGVAWDEMDEE